MSRFWYPPILAYHRTHPDGRTDTPTLSPDAFAQQMALLAERWRPIPLGQLVESLEKGQPAPRPAMPAPRRSVVVTFDDGTEDFCAFALPILARHRIPATLFMIAGQIGQPGYLNENELRSLAGQGITLGSHTLHHDFLPSLPLAQAKESLSASKEILERFGSPVHFLSYPGGGYTEEIARAARSLGYRAACTTNRGTRRFPVNRWALRRITMHHRATHRFSLWLRCCGYYGLLRRLRPPA